MTLLAELSCLFAGSELGWHSIHRRRATFCRRSACWIRSLNRQQPRWLAGWRVPARTAAVMDELASAPAPYSFQLKMTWPARPSPIPSI